MESLAEKKKRCHLAQLRNAVSNFSNPRIMKKVLATGVDANHKFQSNWSDWDFTTSLHIAASKTSATNLNVLLEHGCDVTVKDPEGLTALHRVVRDCLSNNADEPPNGTFVSPVLSAHVKSNNIANPSDNHGFSHFHVACIMNESAAVQFFLNNGVSVEHSVSADSSLFPGYSPLHFATRFASLEVAEILVSRGASVQLKDAKGLTPVHVLIERKIAMFELIEAKEKLDDAQSVRAMLQRINDNDTILKYLLDSEIDIGMPKCHAICTLQKSAVVAQLLDNVTLEDIDRQISGDSPIWPGYTMLHFAAHCNVNTVLLLLDKGANILAQDARGLTPFGICVKWCSMRDLHRIMKATGSWEDIRFSDGKTKLLDCIVSMKSLDRFETFLREIDDANICLPADSALWPGSTLLHLSVMFTERCLAKGPPGKEPRAFDGHIVKACLDFGTSISSRDLRGRAAAHLAFRLGKSRAVEMLLRQHRDNSSDDENLSLLHIACALRNKWATEQWLKTDDVDVNLAYAGDASLPNVEPGWTALHVAVRSNVDSSVAKALLDQGADACRADRNNMTPIHLLLASPRVDPNLSELLLSLADLRNNSADVAFTHLHVASYFNNARAVDKLVDLGANIDALSSLPRFDDCTPLHLAMANRSTRAVEVLVRRGADVLARRRDHASTPLSEALSSNKHSRSLNSFVAVLRGSEVLRRRVEADLGLTLLHVVCRAGHVDAIKDLLSKGADVNCKIRDRSAFWPGWTPLHVLVAMGIEAVHQKKQLNDFKTMLQMLLQRGAQVTIANADGDTPLHLMLKNYPCDTGYFITTCLLSRHKDFSVNPTNRDGLTHFHAACLANNLQAIEQFLARQHVDVNQPVDYFADHYAGSTPLHLALNSNSKRYFGIDNQLLIVDLLLKHKPDLHAEDDHAYTPLHVAADCDPSCVDILRKLIDHGADINARTIDGKTAFEMLLCSKEISVEEIKFFVKQDYQINGCNPMTDRGYMSIILNEKNIQLRADILKALMDAPNIVATDEMGRSAIHNIVATDDLVILDYDYVELINKLTKLGCDVNEQDDCGMTALHLALIFRNKEATTALLISGADINIVDSRRKTAFSYALDPCTRCFARCNTAHDYLLKVLVEHVHKLQLFGLYVSEHNQKMKALALENRWIKNLDLLANAKSTDYDKSKEIDSIVIGPRNWTLGHFLKEHGAVDDYRTLTLDEQSAVDQFFETIDYHSFRDLRYMLKIQYRQAVARGALIKPAIAAIEKLTGLPNLCAQMVTCYLRNPDLKNAIKAADYDD